MVSNITRRTITSQQKEQHNIFLESNPTDYQELEYLKKKFLKRRVAKNFHLFQILNNKKSSQESQLQKMKTQIRKRNQDLFRKIRKENNRIQ